MDANEFIKIEKVENPRYRNKLSPWKAEILKLRNAEMTYEQIKKFLNINGVDVSINSIALFCRKHLNADETINQRVNISPESEPRSVSVAEVAEKNISSKPVSKPVETVQKPTENPINKVDELKTTNTKPEANQATTNLSEKSIIALLTYGIAPDDVDDIDVSDPKDQKARYTKTLVHLAKKDILGINGARNTYSDKWVETARMKYEDLKAQGMDYEQMKEVLKGGITDKDINKYYYKKS
ncbi:Uncharacterised protein [Oligella urethralis]|uniref:hypothetical protein n=1 Tax=Oligella urethralis TaxID=90245 RepID=UPI000E08AAE5|nr:hypothetical protein [Oligella urethralis]SUA61586.1 Uncharacterised protein [Oligella urethralis]